MISKRGSGIGANLGTDGSGFNPPIVGSGCGQIHGVKTGRVGTGWNRP